jgi:hypothetical protein
MSRFHFVIRILADDGSGELFLSHFTSIQVFDAPETNGAVPVQAGPHQQKLGGEVRRARAAQSGAGG